MDIIEKIVEDVNEIKLLNKKDISVTKLVLNVDISKLVNELQY